MVYKQALFIYFAKLPSDKLFERCKHVYSI